MRRTVTAKKKPDPSESAGKKRKYGTEIPYQKRYTAAPPTISDSQATIQVST